MALRSGWLPPTGQTRVTTRLTAHGATTPANPLASRSGILPGTIDGKFRVGGLWMSSSGPMTATVYAGRAVIQGPNNQGAYPVTLDADTVLTFGDGDPLNPRIDLVVLRVYDDEFDSLTRSEAVLEIVKGQPKATPEAPAAPPLSLPLFSVKVKAGASAGTGGIDWAGGASTDLRTTLVGVGGILPVYNNAGVPGSYPGQYQDNDNAHFLQRWDGLGWVAYPKEIGGVAPSGTVSTGTYAGQFRDNYGVLQRWTGTAWANYQPPVEVETTTSATTALPGWTVVAFAARRTRGLATVLVTVTRNGATINVDSAGNLTDEPLCTLPAGWRPAFDYEASACDGFGNGGAYISPGGQINLRTWSSNGALVAGRNVRISATYVL
ncbi:hypothetical protein [Streptomyces tanashiensis]|uniref:Uncharacterized protein n=1 Tax=Streptomyces tanashiensis TaxID=67367 RepID=A0ABY6QWW6_9ACTN|nr:hypothetical protein [Streptomyces tanashiensis]UZX22288.1 hypothetical protein LDH80_16795 [Streptomyces tanashiensis]GGY06501.1 hypothetical protein GCM10010299_07420 [Streptomyces tanashiensis]